jgi:hypothetical protein
MASVDAQGTFDAVWSSGWLGRQVELAADLTVGLEHRRQRFLRPLPDAVGADRKHGRDQQ